MTTVLHFDGFDHYATVAELTEKNGTFVGDPSALSLASPGRSSGQCCRLGSGTVTHVLSPSAPVVATGIAFKYPSLGGSSTGVLRLDIAGTGYGLSISGGQLHVSFGSLITNVPPPAPGQYHYYEAKVDTAAGAVVVKVDGNILVNQSSGVTFAAGNISTVTFGAVFSPACDFDDWYIADDLLGDVACRWLPAMTDGTYSEFTPLSGTNVSNVDDTTPDDDTSYNSDGTSGHRDTYLLDGSSLPASGSVVAIQQVEWARKDDVGDRLLVPTMRQAGTDHDGTGDFLGMSYTFHKEISQVNPETGVAYTLAELTASEFGYKVG